MWLHLWRNIRSAQVWWLWPLRHKVVKSDYHGWHFCCGPFLDPPLSLGPDGKDLVSRERVKQCHWPPSPPPPSSPSSGFPTLSKARSSKRTLEVEVGAASLVAACHILYWVIWSIFRRHKTYRRQSLIITFPKVLCIPGRRNVAAKGRGGAWALILKFDQ